MTPLLFESARYFDWNKFRQATQSRERFKVNQICARGYLSLFIIYAAENCQLSLGHTKTKKRAFTLSFIRYLMHIAVS